PVFRPPSRASEMAVPSCALKPLASTMFWLTMPNPGALPFSSRWASVLRGAGDAAGKNQIVPSVRTPSTSKRTSLIRLARSVDIGVWYLVVLLSDSVVFGKNYRLLKDISRLLANFEERIVGVK